MQTAGRFSYLQETCNGTRGTCGNCNKAVFLISTLQTIGRFDLQVLPVSLVFCCYFEWFVLGVAGKKIQQNFEETMHFQIVVCMFGCRGSIYEMSGFRYVYAIFVATALFVMDSLTVFSLK